MNYRAIGIGELIAEDGNKTRLYDQSILSPSKGLSVGALIVILYHAFQ